MNWNTKNCMYSNNVPTCVDGSLSVFILFYFTWEQACMQGATDVFHITQVSLYQANEQNEQNKIALKGTCYRYSYKTLIDIEILKARRAKNDDEKYAGT